MGFLDHPKIKHVPSLGPPQPKLLIQDDPETHAMKQVCLAIIAEEGRLAREGKLDHLSRRDVLARVFERVKNG